MTDRPVLIALSGLPGTGKTTIARGVSARLGAVLLRIDWIETALARSTLRI
jgi:predicted kinase